MNRKPRDAAELEAELVRLNALVRERRKQLAQLVTCPNKSCHCRLVWREQVEKQLARQVRKIRKQVVDGSPRKARAVPVTTGSPRRRPTRSAR